MRSTDLGAIANRLFEGFLAPLVLGGPISPSRPIGGRAALAIGRERVVSDTNLASHVELGRTRIARKVAPLDAAPPMREAEWALGAILHDLVQATHPGLRGAFLRNAPERILSLVDATLARVPSPSSVGEALARHTWFARLFAIRRVDTVVAWWVGSQTFLGTAPPPRLMAWPELRRVNVERTPRPLMDLLPTAKALDPAHFNRSLTSFLAKTPLTDLASANRPSPAFTWSREALGLVATRAGRTLATRALSDAPGAEIDAALGRATRQLLQVRAWEATRIALGVLGERALAEAMGAGMRNESPFPTTEAGDATFARSAGALIACHGLATQGDAFSESERRRLLALLDPYARLPVAREVAEMMAGADSYFLAKAAGSLPGSIVST